MTAWRDRRAEETLGVALELAKNVGGDLRRREAQFAELNARNLALFDVVDQPERKPLQLALDFGQAAAHEALNRVDDAFGPLDERLAGAVADRDGRTAASAGRGSSATTDGTRFEPSTPGITTGLSPSMYATREFVVPRSIPTTRPSAMISFDSVPAAGAPGPRFWGLGTATHKVRIHAVRN